MFAKFKNCNIFRRCQTMNSFLTWVYVTVKRVFEWFQTAKRRYIVRFLIYAALPVDIDSPGTRDVPMKQTTQFSSLDVTNAPYKILNQQVNLLFHVLHMLMKGIFMKIVHASITTFLFRPSQQGRFSDLGVCRQTCWLIYFRCPKFARTAFWCEINPLKSSHFVAVVKD